MLESVTRWELFSVGLVQYVLHLRKDAMFVPLGELVGLLSFSRVQEIQDV